MKLKKVVKELKHGDSVTCVIIGTEITDAKISINKNGSMFICQNKEDGLQAKDLLGYNYSWQITEKGKVDESYKSEIKKLKKVDPPKADLTETIKELESEIKKLTEENKELKAKIKSLTYDKESLAEKNYWMEKENKELKEKNIQYAIEALKDLFDSVKFNA